MFANLQPTEDPRTNKHIFTTSSEILYVAKSVICKNPLATNVPESKAAGTFKSNLVDGRQGLAAEERAAAGGERGGKRGRGVAF